MPQNDVKEIFIVISNDLKLYLKRADKISEHTQKK